MAHIRQIQMRPSNPPGYCRATEAAPLSSIAPNKANRGSRPKRSRTDLPHSGARNAGWASEQGQLEPGGRREAGENPVEWPFTRYTRRTTRYETRDTGPGSRQTNPISCVFGLKMRVEWKTKPIGAGRNDRMPFCGYQGCGVGIWRYNGPSVSGQEC